MSVELAASEIMRFLKSRTPEVLCITGKWGVGKTYAWNHYLKNAQDKKEIAINSYSYVSLFGRNTIDDVQSAIVENSVPMERATLGPNAETIKSLLQLGGRATTKLFGFSPKTQPLAVSAARIAFALLNEQIICIDDLERAGKGLAITDILGIISQLKEQKNCKIVLLMNNERLEGDSKTEFENQMEKVIDTLIIFQPTPAEAVSIGVDPGTTFHKTLSEYCEKLGILNIRVIKKIERYARQIEVMLTDYDPRILKQGIHSLSIIGYSKFQPGIAPPIEFLKRYNFHFPESNSQPEDKATWRELLSNYEFISLDEFDLLILEGVERGYFDNKALIGAAKDKEKLLKIQDQHGSMEDAWSIYHDSFDENIRDILRSIYNAFKSSVAAVSPLNANGAVRFLREFGHDTEASELVSFYISNRDEPRTFWDLDNYLFRSEMSDPELIAKFQERYESLAPPVSDIGSLLAEISRRQGYGVEDVQRLSQVTPEQFYKTFKEMRGLEMRRVVREALRFRHRGGEGSAERAIGERAEQALEQIASESALNRRRVNQLRAEG